MELQSYVVCGCSHCIAVMVESSLLVLCCQFCSFALILGWNGRKFEFLQSLPRPDSSCARAGV